MTDLPMIVKVKPLAWEDWTLTPIRASCAQTLLGRYKVQERASDAGWMLVFPNGNLTNRESEQASKSAAQADYEARILAALDLTPDPRVTALAIENERLRAEVEAVLQKAAGIVNWFDGNEATSEEVASAVMALSSAGGRAALAEQKAEVWRRAIDTAAQTADDWFYDPEADVVADTRLSATIRALPLPADLGVRHE